MEKKSPRLKQLQEVTTGQNESKSKVNTTPVQKNSSTLNIG